MKNSNHTIEWNYYVIQTQKGKNKKQKFSSLAFNGTDIYKIFAAVKQLLQLQMKTKISKITSVIMWGIQKETRK